jgi:hypothetical protein
MFTALIMYPGCQDVANCTGHEAGQASSSRVRLMLLLLLMVRNKGGLALARKAVTTVTTVKACHWCVISS